MKKNITLNISILALFLSIIYFKVTISKDITLSGTLINNGLYLYDLKLDQNYLSSITLVEDNIYYLETETTKDQINSTLKKINIYSNNITTIKKIEKQDYCQIKNNLVSCIYNNLETIYDLEGKELLKVDQIENINEIIPYKDTFIHINENKITLLKASNIIFRTLNKENINLIDYYMTKTNTHLLFTDNKKNYLYNINEDTLEEINIMNSYQYENGFYFINDNQIIIYDLKNNTTITYSNELELSNFYSSTLSIDNEYLYVYSMNENNLYIENLKTKEIIIYNEWEETTFLGELIIQNQLLFMVSNKNIVFLLNLEETNNSSQSIEDYLAKRNQDITNKIANIKELYNVNIKIKEETNVTYPDFSATELKDNTLILESLDKIETILEKYNKDIFNEFYDLSYLGLNIYLTGTLTPSDYETQVANPAAYSLIYNKEYMIVIDIEQPNIEELICHELEHNLEFNLTKHNISAFKNWNDYNPENFYYKNSYVGENSEKYTMKESNAENVYFIDSYSYTYETEDRARVFEQICANDIEKLKDYSHLYQKALYLKEELSKYYPSLETSKLFYGLE